MKTVLVTGAAGSLGSEIVDILIQRGEKVLAFDNNEAGLFQLLYKNYPKDRFTPVYGDIRDYARIHYAMAGVDICIHTAAMKNLEITESAITEMIQTNVIGTDNVARAAKSCGVECAILVSTDKVVNPNSAYGAGKLLAEEIWKGAARQNPLSRFVVFRSGNFKHSAGNVLEIWQRQHEKGEMLTVTDPEMERHFIDTRKAAEIMCDIPQYAKSGDTIIPKMERKNIMDLMREEFPGAAYRLVGCRQGEKTKEQLKTEDEKVIWEDDNVQVIE